MQRVNRIDPSTKPCGTPPVEHNDSYCMVSEGASHFRVGKIPLLSQRHPSHIYGISN